MHGIKSSATPFIQDAHQQHMLLATLLIGSFTTMMNTSSVNIGLPSFMHEFGMSITLAQWILVGYLLTLAMSMPLVGFMSQRFTPRKLYSWALVAMGVASLICTLAPSLWILVLGRMLQGAMAGLIVPQTMSLIYRYIPRVKQSDYLGLSMMVGALGPAFGPTIGGFLISAFSWRAVFVINLPLIFLAWWFAHRAIPEEQEDHEHHMDFFGTIVVTLGTCWVLVGFTMLENWGLKDLRFIGTVCLGLFAIIYFVTREISMEDPLLNFHVLESFPFALSVLINCTMSMTMTITPIIMAVYLQNVLGNNAFQAGLILLPSALVMVLANQIARVLTHKMRAKVILISALSVCALGNFFLSRAGIQTAVWVIILYLAVRYLGLGMANMPLVNYGMKNLAPEEAGHGSSLLNWCRQTAVVISVNVFSVVLDIRTNHHLRLLGSIEDALRQAQMASVQDMFSYLTLILAFSALLCLFIRKEDDPKPVDDANV